VNEVERAALYESRRRHTSPAFRTALSGLASYKGWCCLSNTYYLFCDRWENDCVDAPTTHLVGRVDELEEQEVRLVSQALSRQFGNCESNKAEFRWQREGNTTEVECLLLQKQWQDFEAEYQVWLQVEAPTRSDTLSDLYWQRINHFRPVEWRYKIYNAAQEFVRLLAVDAKMSPVPTKLSTTQAGGGVVQPGQGRTKTTPSDKRSWTQPELDAKIRSEIEDNPELIAAAKKGKTGAKREAKKLFGRNAIAKRLEVKSARMVSLSKPWQELADAVGLPRKSGRRSLAKVGLAIGLEQHADADDSSAAADVIRRETMAILERAVAEAKTQQKRHEFEATHDKFVLGEMTDEQARQTVAVLQGD